MNDEISDDKRAWLASGYTLHVRKELEGQRDAALSYLMSQCACSSDPIVRSAHAQVQAKLDLLRMFALPKE